MSETKTKLATANQGPTGVVPYDYSAFAGRGREGITAADYKLPFMYLAQEDTKNLKLTDGPKGPDGKPTRVPKFPDRFIPGLEIGDFFCPTTKQIFGKKVRFVMVLTGREFVELTPMNQGGGFHGAHAPNAPIVLKALAAAKGKVIGLMTEDKTHQLQETFKVFAILVDEKGEPMTGVVFPCSSTKIPPYQAIQGRLRSIKGGDDIPLYSHLVEASSFLKSSKADKDYQQLTLRHAVGEGTDGDLLASMIRPDSPIFKAADALWSALTTGAVKAEDPGEELRDATHAAESGAGDAVFAGKKGAPATAGAR
jgi:hypothetical protein